MELSHLKVDYLYKILLLLILIINDLKKVRYLKESVTIVNFIGNKIKSHPVFAGQVAFHY